MEGPRQNPKWYALRSPAAVVAAALVLRLVLLYLAHSAGQAFGTVGQEAGNIAWSMALGRGFSSPLVGMQGPTAWVAPVYPALLALGFKLVQMNPLHDVIFGQVLNCIFSALTCWPIYLLGRKLFGAGVGLASGWAWAVLPTAILFPLEWLWDQSLSALLLTSLLCATLYLRDSARGSTWAAYGAGWALALLTNPATGLLFPVFLAWLAWQRHKTGAPFKTQVGFALLACTLCMVPWTVRNYAAFGRFVPVKSNFGLELWLGNNPDVQTIWSWWRSPAVNVAENADLRRVGEIRYIQQKQSEAVHFILAQPGTFLNLCLGRFVDTWTAIWDYRTDPWLTALRAGTPFLYFSAIFSLLALAGLLLARRAVGLVLAPLTATMLLFPLTYYVTHSAMRYRHPIDPVMTVLAVYALARAYARVAGKASESSAVGSSRIKQPQTASVATRS